MAKAKVRKRRPAAPTRARGVKKARAEPVRRRPAAPKPKAKPVARKAAPKPKAKPVARKAAPKPKAKPVARKVAPKPKAKPRPVYKQRPRRKKAPAVGKSKRYEARIGRTTHIQVKDVAEAEPQYTWRELEEQAAPFLKRRKKGKRRWARLVIEMHPGDLMRPEQYRRLRGKPVIRTAWGPPEELIGRAAEIVEQLQRSEATTPRMKVVVVESEKKPPRKMF